MSYFNTTNLRGEELKKAVQQASSQKEAIRLFFSNTTGKFRPSEVEAAFIKNGITRWDRNSYRRAITDLTTDGFLAKLPQTAPNLRTGKAEHYWCRADMAKRHAMPIVQASFDC